MKLILTLSLILFSQANDAQEVTSELKDMSRVLIENNFTYLRKYSGGFDEIFSLVSHMEDKGVHVIDSQMSARKIIERDLKSLNTQNNLNKCKAHLFSNSIIPLNLKNFLTQGNYEVEYEYEFSGKIATARKNDQQRNNLHRKYRCHFNISSKDLRKTFWSSYYLNNRDLNEAECDKLIQNFSRNDKVLVEFKKYMDYRYDTPMSDGVYSFHCAINLSSKK